MPFETAARRKILGQAAMVFGFMAFLTLHASTNVVVDLVGRDLKALGPFNAFNNIVTHLMGREGMIGLHVALTVLLTWIVAARAFRSNEPEAKPLKRAATPAKLQPVARKSGAQPVQTAIDPARIAQMVARPQREAGQAPQPPSPPRGSSIGMPGEVALNFRHVFPPRPGSGSLTFFGGAPFAPADFEWPTVTTPKGAQEALVFMGQVDCAALPAGGNRHWLPDEGVLYFFTSMTTTIDDEMSRICVQHVRGPVTERWRTMALPASLPPLEGLENARYEYPWINARADAERHFPRSWPRIEMETGWVETFDTLYAGAAEAEGLDGSGYEALWKAWRARRDAALIDFHGAPIGEDKLLSAYGRRSTEVWRPHAGFPQSWLAIDMVAVTICNFVAPRREQAARPAESLSADLLAAYAEAEQAARRWMRRAEQQSGLDEPSDAYKSEFWAWLDALHADPRLAPPKGVYRDVMAHKLSTWLADAAIASAEACLADPAAAARVPAEVVDALRSRHTVLREHLFKDGCVYQHKMFGRGRGIQTVADEYAETHVLLMQFDPDNALAWRNGDAGAFQYWITPDDLLARRFDRVILTFECH